MKRFWVGFIFALACSFFVVSAVSADGYLLSPTDILDIQIPTQPKFSTKQMIAPDGTLSLPFLGRIKASGKSLDEFDQILKTEFAKYLAHPQIVVSLIHKERQASANIEKQVTGNLAAQAPIMIVVHDLKAETIEIKTVKTVQEARAWMSAGDRCSILDKDDLDVGLGDIVKIEIGQPEPDPIYIVFYDVGKNSYDLKKATTIEEARALIGGAKYEIVASDNNASANILGIHPGDTVKIEVGRRPDFLEDNWYKLLSGAGLVIGILNSIHH